MSEIPKRTVFATGANNEVKIPDGFNLEAVCSFSEHFGSKDKSEWGFRITCTEEDVRRCKMDLPIRPTLMLVSEDFREPHYSYDQDQKKFSFELQGPVSVQSIVDRVHKHIGYLDLECMIFYRVKMLTDLDLCRIEIVHRDLSPKQFPT